MRDGALTIGSIPMFSGSTSDLLDALSGLVASAKCQLVVTANVDHLIYLGTSPPFYQAYEEASLRLIDGMPIVALSRVLGMRDVHRQTGADLLPLAARASSTSGWTVAIAGGRPGVARIAAENLSAQHPGSTIVGVEFPILASIDDPASRQVIGELARIKPAIVFICLGSPKQELWLSRWKDELPPAVYVGAGAAVDFAAGTASRAPLGVQRIGIEWVWRLAHEPRRLWKRYLLQAPLFLMIAVRSIAKALRP